MDMSGSSTMPMSMSMSPTSSAAMASSTAMSDMDMGGSCKISMLWNWYTVDACFLSSTWQVTSTGVFAGSCIGVICLVISLEFLRRAQREYDRLIQRQDQRAMQLATNEGPDSEDTSLREGDSPKGMRVNARSVRGQFGTNRLMRGTMIQRQLIRAAIHMVQFAVAYFIMLLAMYYNGYIIICIIIGAFLGNFIFSWDQMNTSSGGQPADVTGCCG